MQTIRAIEQALNTKILSNNLQHDQEEINEVSIQLSQIKKKHDEAKKQFTAKKAELEKIKKEIEDSFEEQRNMEILGDYK